MGYSKTAMKGQSLGAGGEFSKDYPFMAVFGRGGKDTYKLPIPSSLWANNSILGVQRSWENQVA